VTGDEPSNKVGIDRHKLQNTVQLRAKTKPCIDCLERPKKDMVLLP
jgi:hypothetical protein